MEDFETIIDRKIVLEERIKILSEDLGDLKTGRVVDANGFPKAGIDHYSVMSNRSELTRAENDYKSVMSEIERNLPQALLSGKKYSTKPFAVVAQVDARGLAEKAGLMVNDKIIQLDGVTRYEDLREFSLGTCIHVKLLRECTIMRLQMPTHEFSRLGAKLNKIQ